MKCSFCGKAAEEVHKLIAASEKIAICDECVMQCVETLIYPDEMIEINLDDEISEADQNAQKNSGC